MRTAYSARQGRSREGFCGKISKIVLVTILLVMLRLSNLEHIATIVYSTMDALWATARRDWTAGSWERRGGCVLNNPRPREGATINEVPYNLA